MNTRGTSLVEAVLALTLFMVGALVAVRASGAVARLTALSARTSRVARVAQHQLETLRLAGCTASSGRTVEDVLELNWSVSADSAAGWVTLVVLWPDRAGMRADTFHTAFPCGP